MVTTPTVWKARDQINQSGSGSESDVEIIDIGFGRYVAVWTEADGGPVASSIVEPGSDLVGQIFDAEGNTIGSEFLVNFGNRVDDEQDAALAPHLGGGFVAAYEDTDALGTSIAIWYLDVNGAFQDFVVIPDDGTDTLANPSIAMAANGNYLITYERSDNAGDTNIVGRTLSADFNTLSNEFTIFESIDVADDSTNPEVAALSNGNFVVVFEDEYRGDAADIDVKFKILSATGTEISTPSDVIAGTSRLENDPHVAALAGGGFVVVWRDDESDGTGDPGIQATVYDNDGVEMNNFIHVNTTTAGDQNDPEVAALADGGFVVVWNDPGSGVVRGQRFDAGGNKVGSEFTENFSVEDNPVVAALSDGRFIVGFEDVDNAPTDIDIHGTIFDPRTSPINGTANADVLTSRKDGATVNGLGGADTLLGQEESDTLNGGDGNDFLYGRANADFLDGGANDDFLDGGAGVDDMRGGAGNDTYIVDNASDFILENAGQGTDSVFSSADYTLGANIENLTLTGSAVNAGGNGIANVLTGHNGVNRLDGFNGNDILRGLGGNDFLFGGNNDDTLDGGTGADAMTGGAGDDIYYVDNAGDTVIEAAGQGTDTVASSVSHILAANVENLGLSGTANISGTGNSLSNILVGNSGNNALYGGGGADGLDGKGGADDMRGGTGDDVYFVDNAGDGVTEAAGQGTDSVASSVSFTLGANVENLVLTGSAAINGTGNGLANALVGNAGGNTLDDGGVGDDILSGGLGKDVLLGKGGKDVFVFADPVGAANADKIVKFKHKKDSIFLDKDIFAAVGTKVGKKEYFEGSKAQDKNDHIIRKGNKLYYDEDGKGGTKQVLFAKLDKKAVTDHKDFDVGDFVI
ncbi:MAG: calcium-binding protein [Bauldia sp.]|nr:calcium-binding protein [Bauldia sp.]